MSKWNMSVILYFLLHRMKWKEELERSHMDPLRGVTLWHILAAYLTDRWLMDGYTTSSVFHITPIITNSSSQIIPSALCNALLIPWKQSAKCKNTHFFFISETITDEIFWWYVALKNDEGSPFFITEIWSSYSYAGRDNNQLTCLVDFPVPPGEWQKWVVHISVPISREAHSGTALALWTLTIE